MPENMDSLRRGERPAFFELQLMGVLVVKKRENGGIPRRGEKGGGRNLLHH